MLVTKNLNDFHMHPIMKGKGAPPPPPTHTHTHNPPAPKGVTGKVLGWQSKRGEDVLKELHKFGISEDHIAKGNRVLPFESLGREGNDRRVMKDQAQWVAVTGKRGKPGIRPI